MSFVGDRSINIILSNARDGKPLSKEECKYLLGFDETSMEASF